MKYPESHKRIKGRFTEEQLLDFELASALMESGYMRTRTLALILDTNRLNIVAIKQGFASSTEYVKHQARQRINPETGEPFESISQLQDYRARQRINPETGEPFESTSQLGDYQARQKGFASSTEYQAFIKNPLLLIIAALKDSGRPLSIDEIRSYIAETFGITFRKKGKLEKIIADVNKFVPALFTEQSGIYSLNLDSPRLQDILEGDELTP